MGQLFQRRQLLLHPPALGLPSHPKTQSQTHTEEGGNSSTGRCLAAKKQLRGTEHFFKG